MASSVRACCTAGFAPTLRRSTGSSSSGNVRRLLGMLSATLLATTATAQAPPRSVTTYGADQFASESILWATVGAKSQVVVAQKATGKLFLFSPTGELLATAGGKGGGPGEFQLPLIRGWKGDSLWVVDVLARTVSIFTPSLKFHRSFRWPASLSGRMPADAQPSARGASIPRSLQAADRLMYAVLVSDRVDRGLVLSGAEVVIAESTGQILRSLARAPGRHCTGGGILPVEILLCGAPGPAFSPDGRLVAVLEDLAPPADGHGSVRIVLRSTDGVEVFRRTISGQLTSVPSTVADSLFARLKDRNPDAKSIANQLRGARYALSRSILVSADSSVWVEMNTTSGPRWRVLDRHGRDLRTVTVNAMDEVMVVFSNRAFAARRDPDTGNEAVIALHW